MAVKLRVVMLGCGGSAGVPYLGGADGRGNWGACDPNEPRNRRTRSSIAIEGPEGRLLVDAGPDLRTQILANAIPRIDAVLITHHHADHILGLDDVRVLNRILGHAMPLAATDVTLNELRTRFDYAFLPHTGPHFLRPALDVVPIVPGETVDLVGLTVRTFAQDHDVLETLGVRVGNFAYSTDVVRLDETAMGALEGLDTWVVGCFQRTLHPVHAHVDQVINWVERLRPRRTVLTHMGNDLDWDWMRRNLPHGIEPGYDGMVLTL
jgi:phosphoribosyl 1,2-cyclic phosphate phosphodiesterase